MPTKTHTLSGETVCWTASSLLAVSTASEAFPGSTPYIVSIRNAAAAKSPPDNTRLSRAIKVGRIPVSDPQGKQIPVHSDRMPYICRFTSRLTSDPETVSDHSRSVSHAAESSGTSGSAWVDSRVWTRTLPLSTTEVRLET